MRQLKIFAVMLMAVFTLGAVAVSSASAAMALPELTNTNNGTISGGVGKFRGAATITCNKVSGSGTTAASLKLGTYTLDFKECEAFKEECHSLGATAGLIATGGEWHLVLDTLAGTDFRLIWFLVKNLHIECKFLSSLVVVEGNVLCEIKELKEGEFEINCDTEEEGKKQHFREFENTAGEKVTTGIGLESSLDEGAFEKSTEEALKNISLVANDKLKN